MFATGGSGDIINLFVVHNKASFFFLNRMAHRFTMYEYLTVLYALYMKT